MKQKTTETKLAAIEELEKIYRVMTIVELLLYRTSFITKWLTWSLGFRYNESLLYICIYLRRIPNMNLPFYIYQNIIGQLHALCDKSSPCTYERGARGHIRGVIFLKSINVRTHLCSHENNFRLMYIQKKRSIDVRVDFRIRTDILLLLIFFPNEWIPKPLNKPKVGLKLLKIMIFETGIYLKS